MNQTDKSDNMVMLIDILCIAISYLTTAFIIQGLLNPNFLSSLYGKSFIIVIFSYIIIYKCCRRNSINICKRGFYREFIVAVANYGTLALILTTYLFVTNQSLLFSRVYYATFFLIVVLFSFVMRCYLKLIMLLGYKKSSASNKLLVITLSNRADSLILKMQNEYAWMVQVTSIAILDTDMIGSEIRGIKVRGNSDNILDLAKRHIIDEVFIDLPYEYQSNLEDVILKLEKMGIIIHININIYHNLKIQEKIIGNYIGFHVITFATQIFDERQVLLKRLIDILGGLIGTIVMVLLTVIVAPIIKLESAGPIFFSQTRVGKNGRKFKIFKFRSMYQDAEERKKELLEQNEMSGMMFKMNNDPRITKIGKFIRKVSIDEFPQFINVLKGDMSLVGTRPPTIDEFEQYETLHRRRLSIKPGITGLWQISGRSSITDFDEVVKLDLEYIDHWSLALDIKIIFKTIYVVLFGKGAV